MMTLAEVKKILKIIQTFYPNLLKSFSQEDLFMLVKNYQKVFDGFKFDEVMEGLLEFIRTDDSGFPPPPARIIKNIYEKREKERKRREAEEMKKTWMKIEKDEDNKTDEDWLKYENGEFVIVE